MNKMVRTTWNRVAAFLLIAICTISLAGPAAAEGWYMGGSIGQTEVDGDFVDDSDTGFKIFGGHEYKGFAIEFGYVDFGKVSESGFGFSASFEATALFATVNGVFPVGKQKRIHLIPKAGLARWDADADVFISGFGTFSDSDDGFDPLIGLGASFDVGERLAVRVEWERFMDVGDDADVDMLSAGVTYKFSSAK